MSELLQAPALVTEAEWINTRSPVHLNETAGKVRLLFFFSLANSQSLSMLQALGEMANEFDDGLEIIGVLCPRFAAEHSADLVLKLINQHYIRFPVCLDHDFQMWQEYGIQGWPSCAVIDVEGQLRAVLAGQNSVSELHDIIERLLNDAAESDTRSYSPRQSAGLPDAPSFIKYPSGIAVGDHLLYVSDSGHNRILEMTHEGRVMRVFGSGNPGLWDGAMANCGFNQPGHLALGNNALFVADTGNHAIRRIDLFNGEVHTVAGNGKPAQSMVLARSDCREISLNRPVGLALSGTMLYFSMQAQHQIWQIDLKSGAMSWLAGSGQQGVVDGDLVACAFSAPGGLVLADEELCIVDSEGSAVRSLNLSDHDVTSRIGQGNFFFGNEDGGPRDGLLQYPTDLAFDADKQELWIADSFNHCLRVLDTINWRLSTPDIGLTLNHPTAMMVQDRTLWVCNCFGHQLVTVDLASQRAREFDVVETSL